MANVCEISYTMKLRKVVGVIVYRKRGHAGDLSPHDPVMFSTDTIMLTSALAFSESESLD